jgi:hypothetical protein
MSTNEIVAFGILCVYLVGVLIAAMVVRDWALNYSDMREELPLYVACVAVFWPFMLLRLLLNQLYPPIAEGGEEDGKLASSKQ